MRQNPGLFISSVKCLLTNIFAFSDLTMGKLVFLLLYQLKIHKFWNFSAFYGKYVIIIECKGHYGVKTKRKSLRLLLKSEYWKNPPGFQDICVLSKL